MVDVLTPVWESHRSRTTAVLGDVEGRSDLVVVGAGLTGLVTALLAARAGRSVTVLEADRVGAGTTGRSTAKISVLQGTQLSRIARFHPLDTVRDYVSANAAAQQWLADFCAEAGVSLQRRPAYTFASSEEGAASARREHDVARRCGLPVTWVDEPPLPWATLGAVQLPGQAQVDPAELLDALAREAEAEGVRIVEGARVTTVKGRGPRRVVTNRGQLAATQVVVATNAPILDRGGFFARVSPARSYGLAYRTPTQAVDGMYLSAESPSRSLRDAPTTDGHLLLVGGNGHTTGRGGPTGRRLDELREWTAEHFPDARETHSWSAQDYVPHGALPYAGPLVPGTDDLLVAGGYSKWGMTNGVAAALVLAGEAPGWRQVFATWDRPQARVLPGAVRTNAEVGIQLGLGWVRPLLRRGSGAAPAEGTGETRLDHVGAPTAVSRSEGVERRVSAVCTHLGGIVSWNDAERSWDCPLHGSRFGPDGQVLDGPATCGLARRQDPA